MSSDDNKEAEAKIVEQKIVMKKKREERFLNAIEENFLELTKYILQSKTEKINNIDQNLMARISNKKKREEIR